MKTKITDSIIAKIASSYIGQTVKLNSVNDEFLILDYNMIPSVEKGMYFSLMLTDLSDITKEHAMLLANCNSVDFNIGIVGQWITKTGDEGLLKLVKDNMDSIIELNEAHQILTGLGYALPQHALIHGEVVQFSVAELLHLGIYKIKK